MTEIFGDSETMYGRLLEAVHISGYTFSRACSELKHLLEENRWKTIGKGFENIDEFLETIKLSEFKIPIEQRKEIAKKLTQLRATQRATGKLLGVGQATIHRDLNLDSNESKPEMKPASNALPKDGLDSNESKLTSPPGSITLSGSEAAVIAENAARRIEAKQERQIRHQEKRVQEFPQGKYAVVLADPPWKYDNSGFDASAEAHYPTMAVEDICRLPVSELTTNASILFLWAVNPLLPEALRVLTAWGFSYKTNLVWIKERSIGMGWFIKSKHELLLIGVKKDTPHPEIRPDSCFEFKRGIHSEKPPISYEIIESMYPGNKIELFARTARQGWDSWGNEEI